MALMKYPQGNKTRFVAIDARVRSATAGNLSRTLAGRIVKNLHIQTAWQIACSDGLQEDSACQKKMHESWQSKSITSLPQMHRDQFLKKTKNSRSLTGRFLFDFVEVRGFEPLTFCMPCRRATNCAIPPKELVSPVFLPLNRDKTLPEELGKYQIDYPRR